MEKRAVSSRAEAENGRERSLLVWKNEDSDFWSEASGDGGPQNGLEVVSHHWNNWAFSISLYKISASWIMSKVDFHFKVKLIGLLGELFQY